MKELEYPFDAAYIIKKRKSLKKALLADGTSRIRKKIAVFGGSTTSDIVKTLELFLLDAGIEPEFTCSSCTVQSHSSLNRRQDRFLWKDRKEFRRYL